MIEAPAYYTVLYWIFRFWAWTPVVMRRGTRFDLYEDREVARYIVSGALDALESGGEDGINAARAILYSGLTWFS